LPEAKRFIASLTLPNRVESIRLAATFLVHAGATFKVPAVNGMFEVAVVEALNNAVKHGGHNPDACMVCEFDLDGRRLTIRVLDEAPKAPLELAMAAAAVPAQEHSAGQWEMIPESGYGVHLIAAVFPAMRTITRGRYHGIEMEMTF
jgi:anti-sigma regulatory factor (Ser/Thr protein kinase)